VSSANLLTEDLDRYGAAEVRDLALPDKSSRMFVVVDVAKLPPDHPARQLVPADDLLLARDQRLLVLGEPGPDGEPLAVYPASAAVDLTTALVAAQAAKRDAARSMLASHGWKDVGGGRMEKYADGQWPEDNSSTGT
jgi:hypothetical protein